MPRRKWDTRTKALIVLQGLKGTPVSQLCTEHQHLSHQTLLATA